MVLASRECCGRSVSIIQRTPKLRVREHLPITSSGGHEQGENSANKLFIDLFLATLACSRGSGVMVKVDIDMEDPHTEFPDEV